MAMLVDLRHRWPLCPSAPASRRRLGGRSCDWFGRCSRGRPERAGLLVNSSLAFFFFFFLLFLPRVTPLRQPIRGPNCVAGSPLSRRVVSVVISRLVAEVLAYNGVGSRPLESLSRLRPKQSHQ